MSLLLFLQGEQLNRNGQVYLDNYPKLKVKVVDGSSLAVAVVLNSIPKGTSQVVFRGGFSKVAYSVVSALCHKGIKVRQINTRVRNVILKNIALLSLLVDESCDQQARFNSSMY